jgi:hypothetical protein
METRQFVSCKTLNEVINLYIEMVRTLNMSYKLNKDAVRKQIDEDFHQTLLERFDIDEIDNDYVDYGEIIDKISDLDISIEKCSHWLWVTGNTYPCRQRLREAGFRYSYKKRAWYWSLSKLDYDHLSFIR